MRDKRDRRKVNEKRKGEEKEMGKTWRFKKCYKKEREKRRRDLKKSINGIGR